MTTSIGKLKIKRRGPVANAALLRADPTRTTSLRRAFEAQLRKKFAALRGRIVKHVAKENAFDLTTNVFCATGEGGGVDPSCSKQLPSEASWRSKLKGIYDADIEGRETTEEEFDKCKAGGLCDRASVVLKKHLAKQGIKTQEVTGAYKGPNAGEFSEGGHTWLRGPGGEIYDPTEVQFTGERIGKISVYKPGSVGHARYHAQYVENADLPLLLRRRFAALRGRIVKHVAQENAFALTANAFCPTGKGGGVDPSCSSSGSPGRTLTVGDGHEGRLLHGTTEKSAKHFLAGTDLPEGERSKTLSEWGEGVIYTSDHEAPHQALMFASHRSQGKGGKRLMMELQLRKGAKILDLSDEVTRRPAVAFGGGEEIVAFKGKPGITDDLHKWLVDRRAKLGAPERDVRHYVDPTHPEFHPSEYLSLLKSYAEDKGFSAVRLHDETVVLDRNAIESSRKMSGKEVEELKQKPRLRKPYAGGHLYSEFNSGWRSFSINADLSLLNVPDIRQNDHYSCGACSAMAVGRFFGVGPESITDWKDALGTTLAKSTHPHAIRDYLRSLSLDVEEFEDGTIQTLEDSFKRGRPVIVCCQDYGDRREPGASFAYGHYLTVIGVGMGRVFCQDSSKDNVTDPDAHTIDERGRIVVPAQRFMEVWHDQDEAGVKFVRWGLSVGSGGPTRNWARLDWDARNAVTDRRMDAAVWNAFCPTGKGGGVDASCGKEGSEPSSDDSGRAHPDPASQRKAGLLRRAVDKIKVKVEGHYRKLEQRYGPRYAKAILAAAIAGAPVPMPGASFATAAPVVALAELHRRFRPSLNATSMRKESWIQTEGREPQLSQEQIERLGRQLLADVIREGKAVQNAAYGFASDPDKIKLFQLWLKQQFQATIRNQSEEQLWKRYVEAGFRKGAGRAFDDARKSERLKAEMEEKPDFYAGSREEFLRSSFAQPETVEKVKLLAGRAFDDLEGVSEEMSVRMSRVLTDGLVQGQNPFEVAKAMNEVTDLGLTRSLLISRTELIRAHAEGQLDAFERLGVTELGVEVEWSTAGDDRVCPECEAFEGTIYSVEDAHGLIPAHPNCRCAFIPASGNFKS